MAFIMPHTRCQINRSLSKLVLLYRDFQKLGYHLWYFSALNSRGYLILSGGHYGAHYQSVTLTSQLFSCRYTGCESRKKRQEGYAVINTTNLASNVWTRKSNGPVAAILFHSDIDCVTAAGAGNGHAEISRWMEKWNYIKKGEKRMLCRRSLLCRWVKSGGWLWNRNRPTHWSSQCRKLVTNSP